MPTATVKAFNSGVQNKQNFKQGYVRGEWFDKNQITGAVMGQLPANLQVVLHEQNKRADVFVVFSFDTPIAWYSLKDVAGDSLGTNKWYFPAVRYSEKHDGHQHQMRVLLNAMPDNKVSKLLPNGKVMK